MPISDPPPVAIVPAPDSLCNFEPNASIGPVSTVLRDAGAGDLTALRRLLDASLLQAYRNPPATPRGLPLAAEAVVFARICASHRSSEDVRKLAAALCLSSEQSRFVGYVDEAECMMGESIALLERLASEGDDVASSASFQLVGMYPATVKIAKMLFSGMGE